jgi:hypothetical protein
MALQHYVAWERGTGNGTETGEAQEPMDSDIVDATEFRREK